MTTEELADRLAEYDDWRGPPPKGWASMEALNLLARPVEFLLADGSTTERPCISNADWIIEGLRPVAWRTSGAQKPVSTGQHQTDISRPLPVTPHES